MRLIASVSVFDTRPRLSSVFQFGNTRRHESTNIFVRVSSDTGTHGWGEACPVPQLTSATPEEICADIAGAARNHVLGKPLDDIPSLLEDLPQLLSDSVFARAALDTALLDLRARALGVSVADLLGGPRRTSLPVHGSVGWEEDPARMADVASRQAADYPLLKTYLGRADLDSDLGRLKEMRTRVPDHVRFFVDINMLWSHETFAEAARTLRDLGVLAVEQPTPDHSYAVAKTAAENDLMLVWDESITTPEDVLSDGYQGHQGVMNVGISKMGGPSVARAAATIAEARHLPVAVGSLVETGIGSVAGAHLAATIRELPLPSYVMGFLKYENQYTTPPLSIVDGALALPDGPGLGVEVDERAIGEITRKREIVE